MPCSATPKHRQTSIIYTSDSPVNSCPFFLDDVQLLLYAILRQAMKRQEQLDFHYFLQAIFFEHHPIMGLVHTHSTYLS